MERPIRPPQLQGGRNLKKRRRHQYSDESDNDSLDELSKFYDKKVLPKPKQPKRAPPPRMIPEASQR